jgi:hypothetical protein
MFKLFFIIILLFILNYNFKYIELFIPVTITFTDKALSPVIFNYNSPLDFLIANAIKNIYPIKIVYTSNIINTINKLDNNIGIEYEILVNKYYYKYRDKNIRTLFSLYDEYLCALSLNNNKIVKFIDITQVYILKSQKYILEDFIYNLNSKININTIDNYKDLPKIAILFILTTEKSPYLDKLSVKNKLYFITIPKIEFLDYINIIYSKMNIAGIKNQNINKIVNTYKFPKILFTNKYTNLDKFLETVYNNIEYIRRANTSPYYLIPMERFTTESITYLTYIPNSKYLLEYLKTLQIITNNSDPICKNVIGSVKCSPDVLNSNKYRLLQI